MHSANFPLQQRSVQFIAQNYDKINYMSNYRRYFNGCNNPVFITFVTHKRREILLSNVQLLRDSIEQAILKFNFKIIAISILKEHCHLILATENSNDIPNIIRAIKYHFSTNIDNSFVCENLSESAIKRGEKGIWQRRYYDHIIRNEEDLHKHIDYIHYNPMKHYNIAPKDWEYSSFKKFVQNRYYDIDWCNFEDKYQINSMERE